MKILLKDKTWQYWDISKGLRWEEKGTCACDLIPEYNSVPEK